MDVNWIIMERKDRECWEIKYANAYCKSNAIGSLWLTEIFTCIKSSPLPIGLNVQKGYRQPVLIHVHRNPSLCRNQCARRSWH